MPTISTIHRSAGDAKLAGVCGGVAERWGLDPVLVRVGCVLLALTGGIGVILYLAGWLLLPVAGTERATVDDLFGGAAARWPRELWITLVIVACVVSFAVFGAISPFGVAPALALLAVWWFGFHRPRVRRARSAPFAPGARDVTGPALPPPAYGPATPFTQAASAWQARVQQVRSGVWTAPPPPAGGWTNPPMTAPTTPPTTPTTTAPTQAGPWPVAPFATVAPAPSPSPSSYPSSYPAPSPAEEEAQARAAFLAEPDPVGLYTEPAPTPVVRPGARLAARRLRLVTVTALGLTWLGLGVADALGAGISLAVYAGAGLLVVALGLVAATRWGRARGLLPVGVLLAATAVVASGFLGPTLSRPARQATGMVAHPVTYTSAAAFPVDGDHLEVGDLDVDLSGLTLSADATYHAQVETGRVVVTTPPGTGVALHYTVDAGDVEAYGDHLASGSNLEGDRVLVPPSAGQHTLTLDLGLDTGIVEVRS